MSSLKIGDYVAFVTLIAGILFIKVMKPRVMRVLVLLLFIDILVEWSTPLGWLKFKGNNHLLYDIYTPVEFALLAFMYAGCFNNARIKKFALASIVVIVVFAVVNLFWGQGEDDFNSYTFILSCIGLTVLAFFYLISLYSTLDVRQFYIKPFFWISIGILFFYPTSIVTLGLIVEISRQNLALGQSLYRINDILNVLLYACYLVAIFVSSRKLA